MNESRSTMVVNKLTNVNDNLLFKPLFSLLIFFGFIFISIDCFQCLLSHYFGYKEGYLLKQLGTGSVALDKSLNIDEKRRIEHSEMSIKKRKKRNKGLFCISL